MDRGVPEYDLELDKWIPPNVRSAILNAPRKSRSHTKAERKMQYVQEKAFANPRHKGYGSDPETPWPFDPNKAYHDVRYRTGIRNAYNSDWTAHHWKLAARYLMHQVLTDLIDDHESGDQFRPYINKSDYGNMKINFIRH